MRAALDRANRSLYAGRPAEAEALMGELLFPRRSAIAVWLRRAWHRLTCRQQHCFLLFGEFQHPRANRRA